MACSIYVLDLAIGRRSLVGNLIKHTDMNKWLRSQGEIGSIYEVWKSKGIHSRWHWKSKKGKWGRMSTPSRASRSDTK